MYESFNYYMDIIDIPHPERVTRNPDQVHVLVKSGNFKEQGVTVQKVELRLFLEKTDEKLGPFSLITSFVQTDLGSIEMVYDEGYRGANSLKRAVDFLTSNMGLSALILRSIISLKNNSN